MAEATQVTGRCEASPISAVTSPPVPRLISPPSWKVTGPRFETRTRGVSVDIGAAPIPSRSDLLQQFEPVPQQARGQKVSPHGLLAGPSQALAQPRILEDLQGPLGALLHTRDQESGLAV